MKTCIVADEAPIICKVATRILDGHAFEARCAESAVALEAELARAMPDLLIIAERLGEADGIAMVRRVREMPGGKMPTILLCASENGIALRSKVRRSGANGLLLKPFTRETLEAELIRLGLTRAQAA